jgi:peptide/nickel transport system substrate-binding protein
MKHVKILILVLGLLGTLIVGGGVAAARNVFTMAHTQEFGTIDPARGTDYTESYAMLNLYDGLVFPSSTGAIEPKLAESWTITPNGLAYTFNLRRGVKFHDGTELTAEDVKFSLERVLALKEGYSFLWAGIVSGVTADSPYVVTFHLSKVYAPFLATLPWLFIVNKDQILAHKAPGKFGEFGDYGAEWLAVTQNEDAGSGPYTLKSNDKIQEIVFERFLDYWEGWPHGDKSIDEAHSIFLVETATCKAMLRTGELTMVEHWRTYEDYVEMDAIPGVTALNFLSPEELCYKINTKKAPTDDVHIRRMLAWAFDYDTMLNVVEPGSGPARGPIPPGIPGHNPRAFQYYQDLDKAREELKLSKYYPNVPTIQIVTPAGLEARRRVAVQFKETLATLGVNAEISVEQWGRMTDLAATKETTPNIMIISVSSNYPDADTYLQFMYASSAVGTWGSCEWLLDPLVDQLIEQERTTLDPEERAHILNVIQDIIVERCPDIFVNVLALRVATQEYLKGFTYRPVMSFYYYFRDWWFEK